MPAKVHFPDFVRGVAEEKNVAELLPIVMYEEFQSLSDNQQKEVLAKVTKDLLETITLNGLESWLNSIPLVDNFDPVQVGFGLVIRPRTVGDALTIFRNTTLRLHKQAMADAICRAIENLPFADLDEDFFKGYFSHLRFVIATDANLNEYFLTQNITGPLLKKVTKLLLEEKLEVEPFQQFCNLSEFVVLKELKQKLAENSIDELTEKQINGFLYSLGTTAVGALDFAIFDLRRNLEASIPKGQDFEAPPPNEKQEEGDENLNQENQDP